MDFNFPATMTAGTAMAVAPQLCLPLFVGERAPITQEGAAFRCATLLIRSTVRCALPSAKNFATACRMLFGPSLGAAQNLSSMFSIPRTLVSLRLLAVLAIVAALVGAVLFAVLGAPFATSSASAFFVLTIILAPLAPTLGGVFPVLRLFGHAEFYHHHKKGVRIWTPSWMTNSNGSSLATCLIAWCRRMLPRTPTNFRFYLTRINSRSLPAAMRDSKFSLIDLNPAMGTRRKAISHRERLSERTSLEDDATVCSHGNWNHERAAEMTAPALLGA